MKKIILFFAITFLVTGCETNGIRNISFEEAAAFESLLLARDRQAIEQPEKLFTQPVNKTEPCKLPTSQDQLDRKNFRAYWDGDCKNGFAYGLGRDIAISDTHHYEEITIHNGSDQLTVNRPYVFYDFVNTSTDYGVEGKSYSARSGMYRRIENNQENFNVRNLLYLTDEFGNVFFGELSPFDPIKYYGKRQGNVTYQLTDFTDQPSASNFASRLVEILDNKTGVAGGVRIIRFKDGSVNHERLDSNGQVVERIIIPQDYLNHLQSKLTEIDEAIAAANISVQNAQQMEREYLYMACSGKHSIKGLDNEAATKICTWGNQFKNSYATASANYQRRLENMRQQAAIDERQLQIQRQIMYQQAQAQAEGNRRAMTDLGQAFQDAAENMRRNTEALRDTEKSLYPANTNTTCLNTLGGVVHCTSY